MEQQNVLAPAAAVIAIASNNNSTQKPVPEPPPATATQEIPVDPSATTAESAAAIYLQLYVKDNASRRTSSFKEKHYH